MRRSLTAWMLVAGFLVACGGQATDAAPSSAPATAASTASAAPSAATPAPAVSSAPTAVPSPTPAPTPTVKQLAAAFLKAATAVNKANDKAWAAYTKSQQTLAYAKRLASAYSKAQLTFIRAVNAIPWYGDYKAIARRLVTYSNEEYVYMRDAATATSWLEWNGAMADLDRVSGKRAGVSNELRLALGLPPVPIK